MRLFDEGGCVRLKAIDFGSNGSSRADSIHPGVAKESRKALLMMSLRCPSSRVMYLHNSLKTSASKTTDVTITIRPSLRVFARFVTHASIIDPLDTAVQAPKHAPYMKS